MEEYSLSGTHVKSDSRRRASASSLHRSFLFDGGDGKPDDGDDQMKERMRTSDIVHAGIYQNPKKQLILAEFSNSPWTPDVVGCSTMQ